MYAVLSRYLTGGSFGGRCAERDGSQPSLALSATRGINDCTCIEFMPAVEGVMNVCVAETCPTPCCAHTVV